MGQNANAVNEFCQELTTRGIEVVRDLDRVKHGDCLSAFMRDVGASDFLCVFLSDDYLRSPNCMYELLVAWQRSRDNAVEFRKRVKFWVMPGFDGIGGFVRREPYLEHWQAQSKQIAALVKKHATKGLSDASQKEHNTILEISRNVDAMLAFVGDTLSPGTREEFEKWIQSCFPNANQNVDAVDIKKVYQNIVKQIDEVLQRENSVREFLQRAAPGLIQQKAGSPKLTDGAASGEMDLVTVFKGISEHLNTFSGSTQDWLKLGDVCGGLVVLGIDPQWVARQRNNARKDSVDFPADDEVVFLGDGRQANLLHLVSCAVGDGMARLVKVFGKPAIDERRVPDLPGVMKGMLETDRAHQTKLHFIRFVLGSDVTLDEKDQKKVDLKFLETRRNITAAFEDDNEPYFGSGQSFKSRTKMIRDELQIEDFLLIHPDGDDPDRLLNANVRVLRFLSKIFDAVQKHTGQ